MTLLGSTSHALLKDVALANLVTLLRINNWYTHNLIKQEKVGFAITFYVLALRNTLNSLYQ